ncbi:cytochrome C oxidase subunit IV family protein [Flavobacterium sp. SM2513]|uniref:cytochrome C oxidase subunit IV family protein n=1 Tax=Flavobacterium sp. SM2513 TaxID=3424766 RepID=UPI003D7F1A34
MKLSLTTTYISVLILIMVTALLATFAKPSIMVPAIMVASLFKFWLVVFQFMELKKGNIFWKVLIIAFGFLLGLIVVLLL